jgi:hypothetical protein
MDQGMGIWPAHSGMAGETWNRRLSISFDPTTDASDGAYYVYNNWIYGTEVWGGILVSQVDNTAPTTYKFRIWRDASNNIYMQYWNNQQSRWEFNGNTSLILMTTADDFIVSLFNDDTNNNGGTSTATFDNFQVVSGCASIVDQSYQTAFPHWPVLDDMNWPDGGAWFDWSSRYGQMDYLSGHMVANTSYGAAWANEGFDQKLLGPNVSYYWTIGNLSATNASMQFLYMDNNSGNMAYITVDPITNTSATILAKNAAGTTVGSKTVTYASRTSIKVGIEHYSNGTINLYVDIGAGWVQQTWSSGGTNSSNIGPGRFSVEIFANYGVPFIWIDDIGGGNIPAQVLPSSSVSPSKSPSSSVSPSASASKSPSSSISPSISPSSSGSASNSPSGSPSKSPSTSVSPSVSPSESPSKSPSGSASPSASTSPSIPPGGSGSVSPSVSPSASRSVSPSVSPSASSSISPSSSSSPSKSPSSSNSPSGSASNSPSTSRSVSPSVSASGSASVSPSQSRSVSPSVSSSISPSYNYISFPHTPILDNFNRGDGVASGWIRDFYNGTDPTISGQKLTASGGFSIGSFTYAQEIQGPDIEMYATVSGLAATSVDVRLQWNWVYTGRSYAGRVHYVVFQPSTTGIRAFLYDTPYYSS